MPEKSVKALVAAVKAASGDAVDVVDELPFDPSHLKSDKMHIRVAVNSWVGQDAFMDSAQPISGRASVTITTYANWQAWGFDTAAEENRKVIREMARLGYSLNSVSYSEDDSHLVSTIDFDALDQAPY